MEEFSLDYQLDDSSEKQDAKLSLLKQEQEVVKKQKYKYYFLATFIFLATVLFIFWATKSNGNSENRSLVVEKGVSDENMVGDSMGYYHEISDESQYETDVGKSSKKKKHHTKKKKSSSKKSSSKKASKKHSKKSSKSSTKHHKSSSKSSTKHHKPKKSLTKHKTSSTKSTKHHTSKTHSSKHKHKKKNLKEKEVHQIAKKKSGHWNVYYTKTALNQENFCNLTWVPYFTLDENYDWHNDVHEGDHYYRTDGVWKAQHDAFQKMATKYWHYTQNLTMPVDVLIEGRSKAMPKEPNNIRVAQKYTNYDGFIFKEIGKIGKNNIFEAVLEKYSCGFRYLDTFDLNEPKRFNKWCETKDEKQWLVKPNYGCHGIGIHLVNKTESDDICDANKNSHTAPLVMQEFLGNPALIEGYKFHCRFLAFFVAKPFVMYAAPRQSYFRFSGEKYNTKSIDGYITNEGDCMLDNCLQFDSDFVGKTVKKKDWMRGVSRMAQISYLIVKEYYGDKVRRGKVSSNRFTWIGFDYLFDDKWNPLFTEWNEEPQLRHHKYPEFQVRMGNFVDGMFSIASGYAKHMPQKKIDAISRKYQFLKVATINDPYPVYD